jgi:hypothetical protein
MEHLWVPTVKVPHVLDLCGGAKVEFTTSWFLSVGKAALKTSIRLARGSVRNTFKTGRI